MKQVFIILGLLLWLFGFNLLAGFVLAWGYWTVNMFGYIFFVLALNIDLFIIHHLIKE